MIMTQTIVQQHMTEFIDKMTPGATLAVFSLSADGQLSILQGFTSDHDLLKAAINSKKLSGQIPPIEDSGQEPRDVPDPDQEKECNHAAFRGQYSISAMKQMTRYLSGLPGRKNLIWVSGSFPLTMNGAGGAPCYDFTQDLKAATDSLARAHVVLYPVDPRALDILARYGGSPKARIVREQIDEHLTMESVAEQTGGKALYNNNDLGALAAAPSTTAPTTTPSPTPPPIKPSTHASAQSPSKSTNPTCISTTATAITRSTPIPTPVESKSRRPMPCRRP
jgi:VWFA-related protein